MADPLPHHSPSLPSRRLRALLRHEAARYGTSQATIVRAYARFLERSVVTVGGWRYGDGPGRGVPAHLLTRLENLARTDDLALWLQVPGVNSGRPSCFPGRAMAPDGDTAPENPGSRAIVTGPKNSG